MGDVIHVLPALTDATEAIPNLEVDFVVEQPFAEIPDWHPSVTNIIPVATRKWRKSLWRSRAEILTQLKQIRQHHYDLIIDAQGLGKSAFMALCSKGTRHGYDRHSVREPFASYCYNKTHKVNKNMHAIDRIRHLFASALNYSVDEIILNYGLTTDQISAHTPQLNRPFIMLLHGTTWVAKEWPEEKWQSLAKKLSDRRFDVYIPWGNEHEKYRAERIASQSNAIVLDKMNLSQLAIIMSQAKGVVAVDTGLGHLSAALSKPTVSIYGPTQTELVGTRGENQAHLSASDKAFNRSRKNKPFDYDKVSVEMVLDQLKQLSVIDN